MNRKAHPEKPAPFEPENPSRFNFEDWVFYNSWLDKKLGSFNYYLIKLVVLTSAFVISIQSRFPNQAWNIAWIGYFLFSLLFIAKFYSQIFRLDSFGKAQLNRGQMVLFHLGLYCLVLLLQPMGIVIAPMIALAVSIMTASQLIKNSVNSSENKKEGYTRPDDSYSSNFSNRPENYYDNHNYKYSVFHTQDERDKPVYTSHGSAHWISDRIKNELTDSLNGKPTLKGLWLGGGFFHHKEGNLVTVAPPGKGKGASIIIPNLLWRRDYKHSFVVFDPKGTNACITARFQQRSGKKVFIIDPMNLQKDNNAVHGIDRAKFNPLDFIESDIYGGCNQIANLLMPEDPQSNDKYWNKDAKNLIHALLMHIMTYEDYIEHRNLVTFFRLLNSQNFEDILAEMQVNEIVETSGNRFSNMWEKNEQMFSTVLTMAISSVEWLSNPAIQESLTSSSFNPADLEHGNMAVYICTPMKNKEGFATFSRLIIGSCLRTNSHPSPTAKSWVYYLLDEFPNFGYFPEVLEAIAISREYRMRIWIFAQSLSQLDRVYGLNSREEIVGCSNVFQVISSSDIVTQEYVSKRIGNKTVNQPAKSRTTNEGSSKTYGQGMNTSSNSGYSDSVQDSFFGVPLIEPSQIPYEKNIITLTDWGPMRLVKVQYWDKNIEKNFYTESFNDGRADPNPNFNESRNTSKQAENKKTYGPNGNNSFVMD